MKRYDGSNIPLCKILKQHIQLYIIAMEVMKMYNIRFYFIHPSEKVPRRYMREIGLFAMDAREEGMQLVVEGVSYNITMLSFTHFSIWTCDIALDAGLEA